MSSCDLMYFLEVGLLRRKERVRVTDSLILGVWGGGDRGREVMVKHGYQYTTSYTHLAFQQPSEKGLDRSHLGSQLGVQESYTRHKHPSKTCQ